MPVKRKHKQPKDPRKAQGQLRATMRKRVFAMYDTCGICGNLVDKTLKRPNPLAPELDEIIPIARGGSPYDIDNLQLTHGRCNRMKGSKVIGDKNPDEIVNPIPVSRDW